MQVEKPLNGMSSFIFRFEIAIIIPVTLTTIAIILFGKRNFVQKEPTDNSGDHGARLIINAAVRDPITMYD